jgi:ubiquinone/menaquinone biosynthesis C-methylase UbiE
MQASPGENMLELGCGAGFYASAFAARFGMKVVAVDASAKMLTGLDHPNIRAVHSAVENLRLEDIFDAVLAAGSLEFMADLSAVFRLAFRYLRPGGRFVVLVPAPGWRGSLYGLHHRIAGCPVFVRGFEEYLAEAERAGFTVEPGIRHTPFSAVLRFGRP